MPDVVGQLTTRVEATQRASLGVGGVSVGVTLRQVEHLQRLVRRRALALAQVKVRAAETQGQSW